MMTRKEVYEAVIRKFADNRGVVRGYPVSFLYNIGYGCSEEEWNTEIDPQYVRALAGKARIDVNDILDSSFIGKNLAMH